MPGTVDDFIRRFGGSDAVSEQPAESQASQAAHYIDRFASNAPEDQEFDNQAYHEGAQEYLGKLPDDQFQQAASKAYAQLEPDQKEGLPSSLLSALQSRGVNPGSLGALLGLNSTDPQQMSPGDVASVANYARHEHPGAMRQVVADKPWWLKAMGHPVVMGALGMIAAKMLRSYQQGR